jgi:gliding motility-associated lipoprotein GldH
MRQKIGLLAALTFVIFGCDSSRVFEDFKELPEGWALTDTVKFVVALDQTKGSYDFTTQFRCESSYPYSNLYYHLQLKNTKDSVLHEGLNEVNFFEPKTGKPLGSGLGDLYHIEHVALEKFSLTKKDSIQISIVQYMRIDLLQGIDRVGLRVNVQED